MMKRMLIGAVAVSLSCASAAHAQNKFTKEEGVGMLSGAAVGAVAGGPIGAAVGFMVGGILGDNIGLAKRADLRANALEKELMDARLALSEASERSGGDAILDALAQKLHADVLFRTASAELDYTVATKIEDLGALLGSYPQLEIELHGFADPRGKPADNLRLSLECADSVRQALVRGGADPHQIRVAAYGADLATSPQGDLEAYAWERRVSLAIRPSVTPSLAQSR